MFTLRAKAQATLVLIKIKTYEKTKKKHRSLFFLNKKFWVYFSGFSFGSKQLPSTTNLPSRGIWIIPTLILLRLLQPSSCSSSSSHLRLFVAQTKEWLEQGVCYCWCCNYLSPRLTPLFVSSHEQRTRTRRAKSFTDIWENLSHSWVFLATCVRRFFL